jgi:hypothetical protein
MDWGAIFMEIVQGVKKLDSFVSASLDAGDEAVPLNSLPKILLAAGVEPSPKPLLLPALA